MEGSQRHGHGAMTYANGDKYVGEWKNDRFDGHGTYIYADGSQDVGEWKNGKNVGKNDA